LGVARKALARETCRTRVCLINEPHAGLTTWGGYDGREGSNTDIRAIYIRVGNAIHAIDHAPLIVVEGVQNYKTHAYEGDLRGVAKWPVTLNLPHKVVYSVHSYPAEVSAVPPDYGPKWVERMNSIWGYIVKQKIAPVFIGECDRCDANAGCQSVGGRVCQLCQRHDSRWSGLRSRRGCGLLVPVGLGNQRGPVDAFPGMTAMAPPTPMRRLRCTTTQRQKAVYITRWFN
jgi:hypothetical protein